MRKKLTTRRDDAGKSLLGKIGDTEPQNRSFRENAKPAGKRRDTGDA
jgi:hypothetical protein